MDTTSARVERESKLYNPTNTLNGAGVSVGFVPNPSVRKWRRPSVAMERSRLLVAASVPEGCVLAPRVSVWLEAVREVAEARGLRDVQVVTVVRVARGLCDWVDGASRTTRVVNERVAELAGCCVRTVQRWLRRLEQWGLLGLVAGGRSARWAPLARSQDAEGRVVLERRNEAAVRSLVVPEGMAAAAPALASSSSAGRGPVDNEGPAEPGCGSRCHPYPSLGILDPRTRARGGLGGKGLVPLRGAEAFLGAAARPGGRVRGDRQRAWWSPRRTRSTEEAVLGLARELQERLRVLRGCSDRYVMRVIRPFFGAGWSGGDLVGCRWRRGGRSVRRRMSGRWRSARPGWWLGMPSAHASPRSAPRGAVDPGRGSSPPGGRPWRPPDAVVRVTVAIAVGGCGSWASGCGGGWHGYRRQGEDR